ncbi:hypothetical protein AJ80_00021 [Polytolypa hystricis UAMH7299]|uniref:Xylanolytic transcriptional activator regulatory domain-containing protein n=1 Tax=Polytolypa hystricis (strain UAMH7299) TaxID=1447883 RepID=A0A2B7Z446_POLH7|nr:hypothetical protein AJ80_00021 [Polytolypa hystricis UAMH7299]
MGPISNRRGSQLRATLSARGSPLAEPPTSSLEHELSRYDSARDSRAARCQTRPRVYCHSLLLTDEPSSAYQNGHMSAKCCVCAFMAVAGLFNLQDKAVPVLDSETFAWKTQFMLPLLSLETTLDGLHACVMMLVFHLLSGNLQPGVFLSSCTSGLVFLLGLRNIFWVCYVLDKDFSLRTGQPPAINDDHCDLTLPTNYGEHLKHQISTHHISSENPVEMTLLGDLRLSKIKGKTYNMLYSIGALRKSDTELLKSIRELDNELEAWRVSVPHRCRPTLTFSKDVYIFD